MRNPLQGESQTNMNPEGSTRRPQGASASENALSIEGIVEVIFNHLDMKDMCRAATVCKLWHRVATHPDFWRTIDASTRKMSPGSLVQALRKHPGTETLIARGINIPRPALEGLLPGMTQLRDLTLQLSTSLTDMADLISVDGRLPSLTRLSLVGGMLPPLYRASVAPALANAANDEWGLPPAEGDDHIQLYDPLDSPREDSEDEDPHNIFVPLGASPTIAHASLRCLELSTMHFRELTISCPALEELKFDCVDMSARPTVAHSPSLHTICVVGRSTKGGHHILQTLLGTERALSAPNPLPGLKHLEISRVLLADAGLELVRTSDLCGTHILVVASYILLIHPPFFLLRRLARRILSSRSSSWSDASR